MQTSVQPAVSSTQTARRPADWLRYLERAAPLLIAVFIFVVFARTFDFGLYLDDHHHARLWALSEVLSTFAGPFDPLGIEPPYFRPMVVVTFAIDWNIWGFNAWVII